MIGIVLPSIDLPMTIHPDHILKPEPDPIITESSVDEQPALWLCIGDQEDIATKNTVIFRTSPLQVGDGAGDEQVTLAAGMPPVCTFPRQTSVRREFP